MPDWIASRTVVVALAVIGAVVSVAASVIRMRGQHTEAWAKTISRVGYAFMWVSIALFIYAGFTAGWE